MSRTGRVPASFRDPSGFLFRQNNILYRQINHIYQSDYDKMMGSGLYDALVSERLLIPHDEVDLAPAEPDIAYRVIRPKPIPFISYPYEWSFSQLKDAALLTLAIERRALDFGMSLKDASAYNVQFYNGRPILIDTLSFETYREGEPWVAYRQFCQHFLAPLALMSYRDVRLQKLLQTYIDGVPLDMASSLLPFRTRFLPSLAMHIHIHASAQKRYADQAIDARSGRKMSRTSFIGIIESLKSTVHKLHWKPGGTEWADYYDATNYTDAAGKHKTQLIAQFLDKIKPQTVWDLGANTGPYSRLASKRGIRTIAFDIDPSAVERNYIESVAKGETHMLPLVMDLTNPSPAIGWHHQERQSLLRRSSADGIFALALIHHLAIANNVPLPQLAYFFSEIGRWLIIEFVPKSDSQVQKLLASRQDIFPNYTQEGFEQAFGQYFVVHEIEPIHNSERILYLLERRPE